VSWEIHSIGEFKRFSHEWDTLNVLSGSSPLLDSRFVVPLLDVFGTGRESIAICRDSKGLCALTIIAKNRHGYWETFQPSQAPLGCWIQRPGSSTEQLTTTLRKALPGFTVMLGITQQDPDILPRPTTSEALSTLDYIKTARIPVNGSFEEYWAARGKNLRQNLRRQRNRLGRENVQATLTVLKDAEQMHNAVQAYGELESAGWKAGQHTAIHINNDQGRFYKLMLAKFAETEQALVFQYYYNNALVATDLCIVGGGSLVILKTTYNEEITTSSPAMLMREESFAVIFEKHLATRIEFYGKLMDWHKRWAEEIRTLYHVNVWSLAGRIVNTIRTRLPSQ